MSNDVGKRIAALRKGMGLSQEELAERADVHRVLIAKYETGKNEPSPATLVRIASVLNVTTDSLLGVSERTQDEIENDERWAISEHIRQNPELRILFSQAKGAKPEAIRAAVAVLKSLEGDRDD